MFISCRLNVAESSTIQHVAVPDISDDIVAWRGVSTPEKRLVLIWPVKRFRLQNLRALRIRGACMILRLEGGHTWSVLHFCMLHFSARDDDLW